MSSKLKENFRSSFWEQPLQIKILFILAFSIFLPFFITVPLVMASVVYFFCRKKLRAAILSAPNIRLYGILGLLLLATPLFYKNYDGFGCGILLILYFIVALTAESVMSVRLRERLCDLLCAGSLLAFAAAVIEKLFTPGARVTALSYNANFYGYLAEIVILICFYRLAGTKKPAYLLIVAANVCGIFLADCRSAWSGLLVGFIVLFAVLKMRKSLIGVIALAAVIIGAMLVDHSFFPRHGDIGATTLDRFRIWSTAFHDFLQHPIFGRGLLAMYQVTGNFFTPHAHNIPLDLLECTGVAGTGIIVFFFIVIIRQLAASYKSGGGPERAGVALCWSVIAATLAHGVTDMPIMGVHTGLLFLLILAMRPKAPLSGTPVSGPAGP
jgi:Lipid A core - O-antigen ligase and related enzymes